VSIKYNRTQALAELDYWESKAARSDGTRPIALSVDLSGF